MVVYGLSSKGRSVEEGRVEVELKRAEDDELSLWHPLEAESCVPPLPLYTVSRVKRLQKYFLPITRITIRSAANKMNVFVEVTSTQWPAIAHTPGVSSIKRFDALWPLENSEGWFRRILFESISGGFPTLKTFGDFDRHMNGAGDGVCRRWRPAIYSAGHTPIVKGDRLGYACN